MASEDRQDLGDSSKLPPELVSHVLSHLSLKELLPCRHINRRWSQMVQLEARLRMLELIQSNDHPLTLQAGPPALIDLCEYLTLSFDKFSEPTTITPLLASLSVKHTEINPTHASTMGDDDSQVFQNMVICITRSDSTNRSALTTPSVYTNRWSSWQVARETGRIWRDWWCDVPEQEREPTLDVSEDEPEVGLDVDSGFANVNGLDKIRDSAEPERSLHAQSLSVGKIIHQATIGLSRYAACFSNAERHQPAQHCYQWRSVDLDVFRVVLAHEERTKRVGTRAVFNSVTMVF